MGLACLVGGPNGPRLFSFVKISHSQSSAVTRPTQPEGTEDKVDVSTVKLMPLYMQMFPELYILLSSKRFLFFLSHPYLPLPSSSCFQVGAAQQLHICDLPIHLEMVINT